MVFIVLSILSIAFLCINVECMQNGNFISITEAPYFASLLKPNNGIYCGAAILSEYWVVSAAHCFDYPVKIRTGSTKNYSNGTIHGIDRLIPHENYTQIPDEIAGWIVVNDIGLIKLKEPIKFNKYQQPIKLRSNVPKENDTVIIIGLGYERVLKITPSLKKTTQSVLAEAPSFAPKPPSVFHLKNSTSHTCPGDSGSPGVIDNELAGVVSFGDDLCQDWYHSSKIKYSGALTRIDMFYHWILNQTGIEY